jgi:mono/diheme cytochrome c family protein
MSARWAIAASVFAMPLVVGGCTAQRTGVNAWNPAPTMVASPAPPRNYANACGTCHDRGGFGVQVLADRLGKAQSLLHVGTRMPAEAIRVIVRQGVGAMPAMSKLEVTDAELDGIVAYLGRRAQAPPAP